MCLDVHARFLQTTSEGYDNSESQLCDRVYHSSHAMHLLNSANLGLISLVLTKGKNEPDVLMLETKNGRKRANNRVC